MIYDNIVLIKFKFEFLMYVDLIEIRLYSLKRSKYWIRQYKMKKMNIAIEIRLKYHNQKFD